MKLAAPKGKSWRRVHHAITIENEHVTHCRAGRDPGADAVRDARAPPPIAAGPVAAASSAPLTHEQRRAYLHYYSPIILKRAHENAGGASGGVGGRRGHDWITGSSMAILLRWRPRLSNNRRNWALHKSEFLRDLRDGDVDGDGRARRHPAWEIRPTLYTALLEFEAGDGTEAKSMILLYHVYPRDAGPRRRRP